MGDAVLDNTALRSLYVTGLLGDLKLLYSHVYIPQVVQTEFLQVSDEKESINRSVYLINMLEENMAWLHICNVYNDLDILLFKNEITASDKLHSGEIETMVQRNMLPGEKVTAIVDEMNARKFMETRGFDFGGTLSLIAKLDIKFGLCDYHEKVSRLLQSDQYFSQKVIDLVYKKVREEII